MVSGTAFVSGQTRLVSVHFALYRKPGSPSDFRLQLRSASPEKARLAPFEGLPPVVPLFWREGSPTKIDYRKTGYPDSNLCTGGPSGVFCLRNLSFWFPVLKGTAILPVSFGLQSNLDWATSDASSPTSRGLAGPWKELSGQLHLG